MANSANPEINKKIATSALGTLVIATVFFYLGDRYAETLVTYPGQIFDHLSDAFLSMWQTIKDAPFALDMTSNSLLFGGACFLIIWMIWLRYVAFIGNYRSGEESGSARWGTVKEGKKFKDLQTEDNNLLFTKNFGLALHRPKFDPEYDRNLNVLVVGGSGSGKTFNYVTPNICQLNTSYFVTDPKGTLLKDAGYLFTDNGYKLKSFWLCSYSLIVELIVHPFNSSDRSRSARNPPCRIANHRPCTDVHASSLRKIPLPCRPRPDGTGLS